MDRRWTCPEKSLQVSLRWCSSMNFCVIVNECKVLPLLFGEFYLSIVIHLSWPTILTNYPPTFSNTAKSLLSPADLLSPIFISSTPNQDQRVRQNLTAPFSLPGIMMNSLLDVHLDLLDAFDPFLGIAQGEITRYFIVIRNLERTL
jgi:hypothetical protein